MKKIKHKVYYMAIIISLILAIVLGIYCPSLINSISFLGTIYLNLLKFMIVPVIFTSVSITIFETKKFKSNILGKTILTFLVMFIISFLITSIIVLLIKPGIGYEFIEVDWTSEVVKFDIASILTNIFPDNMIKLLSSNSIFGTIILALVFGLAASKVKNGKEVMSFMKTMRDIFMKILEYIMYLTPIGIFALVGNMVAKYKLTVFLVGIKYVLIAYLCSIIIFILVMMIPACIIQKISPFSYLKRIFKVVFMAITTCSSVATLPKTIETCRNDFKIEESTTDIVVPLGCTIHMCGGAVSFALLGIFCLQYFQMDITFSKYLLMLVSATLINMAAPGIPSGGIVIGASYLSILNVPLDFIGFYSSIYKLLDMSYTSLNVVGDITANVIINKFRKKEKVTKLS